MKNNLLISILIGSTIMMNSCNKEECDNWANAAAGTYTGSGMQCALFSPGQVYPATTTIVRVNDTLLNLQLTIAADTFCLDSVRMTSETTIYWRDYDACFAKVTEGSGSFNGHSSSYNFVSADTSWIVTFDGSK